MNSYRIKCVNKKAYKRVKQVLESVNIKFKDKESFIKIKDNGININDIYSLLVNDHISFILYEYDKNTKALTRVTSHRDTSANREIDDYEII